MTLPPLISDPREILVQGSQSLGIALSEESVDKMMTHLSLLRAWSARTNLTALTDPTLIAVLHFLDSLTVFKVIGMHSGLCILDIGSGAGFPGVVLLCADKSLKLTMVERNLKKMVFLKYLAHELALNDVSFLNVDLYDLLRRANGPRVGLVVSRAFSSDFQMLDSLHAFLEPAGLLVHMGGPSTVPQDLSFPHFQFATQWNGTLPFSEHFRRVSLFRKLSG